MASLLPPAPPASQLPLHPPPFSRRTLLQRVLRGCGISVQAGWRMRIAWGYCLGEPHHRLLPPPGGSVFVRARADDS